MRTLVVLVAIASTALVPSVAASLPPACAANCVYGTLAAWAPSVLSVPVGAVVTFEAVDLPVHPAELDGQKLLSRSGALTRYEATTPGDWEYRCQVHAWMIGRITVT